MKHNNVLKHQKEFAPLMQSAAVQAAVMTLNPGDSSSEKIENEHPDAEQWLVVMSGTGVAKVGRHRVRLRDGDLLLIPKKTPHQIINTGRTRLVTVNFYAPPAYTREGDVKPSVAQSR